MDPNDEFFGDQSDDEEYRNYKASYSSSSSLSSSSSSSPSTSRPVSTFSPSAQHHAMDHHKDHGALDKHETNAQGEMYRNIGYHEAYDEYKEVRLQEGFEAGYRANFDDAKKLGDLLGKWVVMNAFKEDIADGSGIVEAGSELNNGENVIEITRAYLEKMQSNEESTRELETKDDDIHDVMEKLEKMLALA